MNPPSNSKEIRAFLLDRLSPEQTEAIEEQMVVHDAFFSELQDAEDELIDEFVQEEMDAEDARLFRERIERNPELRKRVTLRRTLIRHLRGSASRAPAAAPLSEPKRRSWRLDRFLVPGFALVILVLLFICYNGLHNRWLPSSAVRTPSAPAKNQPDTLQGGASSAAAVLFLPAHVARGAGQQSSILHLGHTGAVKLELESPDATGRWRVTIASGNHTVLSVQDLVAQQTGVVSYVVAPIQAAQLPPNQYRVTLSPESGSAPSSSWDLRVIP